MSAQDKDCVVRANANISKAVKMGKRINKKACQDHASFIWIIKSGATALNGAWRDKTKAKAHLKKSKATAAVASGCAIHMIKEAHTNEKVKELTKTKASNEKKIHKLEKKIEELKKKLEKVKSTLVSHEMRLDAEDRCQERKEARKTKTKKKCFGDAATLYKSGGSLNRRSYSSSPSYDRSRSRRSSNRSRSPHPRSIGRSRSASPRRRSNERNRSRQSSSHGRSSDRSRRSRSRSQSSDSSHRSSSRDRRSNRSRLSSSRDRRSKRSRRSSSRLPSSSRRALVVLNEAVVILKRAPAAML
jgi:chaperonin cofactor prefoldin